MARIRTIKPEFFTSETISQLPLRTRLTFIGLWTHCDDHGRCKAHPKLVKAAVWPLDDVSLRDVESDLNTLADRGLIEQYHADGRDYLAVTAWDEHQAAAYRRGDPKHPAPPLADHGGESQSHGERSHASKRTVERGDDETPGQQERANRTTERAERTSSRAGTGTREQGTGKRTRDAEHDFAAWWEQYPRKVDRKKAETAFARLSRADQQAALAALPTHIAVWRRDGTDSKFIPHPTTWLHNRRWEAEMAANKKQTGGAVEADDGMRYAPGARA